MSIGMAAASGPKPEFMSALLTFILGGAIVLTVAGSFCPYSKAIVVCQGFGSGA
jgi:hypothetical protein